MPVGSAGRSHLQREWLGLQGRQSRTIGFYGSNVELSQALTTVVGSRLTALGQSNKTNPHYQYQIKAINVARDRRRSMLPANVQLISGWTQIATMQSWSDTLAPPAAWHGSDTVLALSRRLRDDAAGLDEIGRYAIA